MISKDRKTVDIVSIRDRAAQSQPEQSLSQAELIMSRAVLQHFRWMTPVELSEQYRRILREKNERLTIPINAGPIPTDSGDWQLIAIGDKTTGSQHEMLVLGGSLPLEGEVPVYVCVGNHLQETFYHVNGQASKEQLHGAMAEIVKKGCGVIVYIQEECIGGSIESKMQILAEQYYWENDQIVTKPDTSNQDYRKPSPDWDVVYEMLGHIGLDSPRVELMSTSLQPGSEVPQAQTTGLQLAAYDEAQFAQIERAIEFGWGQPWDLIDTMKEALLSQGKDLSKELGRVPLPTEYGDWTLIPYGDKTDGNIHYALVYGDISEQDFTDQEVPVRVHSACHTSETYHAINCECRQELQETMKDMQVRGKGVILYLQQEGRGNGVVGKLDQLKEMFGWDNGAVVQNKDTNGIPVDTVSAYKNRGYVSERREFAIAGEILKGMGITQVELATNNPRKIKGLEDSGIIVVRKEIHIPPPNPYVAHDLRAKAKSDGHLIGEVHYTLPTTTSTSTTHQ